MPLTNEYESYVRNLYKELDKFEYLGPLDDDFSKHLKKMELL